MPDILQITLKKILLPFLLFALLGFFQYSFLTASLIPKWAPSLIVISLFVCIFLGKPYVLIAFTQGVLAGFALSIFSLKPAIFYYIGLGLLSMVFARFLKTIKSKNILTFFFFASLFLLFWQAEKFFLDQILLLIST